VTLYIPRFAFWKPPEETPQASPDLSWTDPVFRRRLSQLTKMTIHVIHCLMPGIEDLKTVFVSFMGEISQQYKINKMQIQDGEISPAAFSISVFNTAPAKASIAMGLEAGYTAIYPKTFYSGFAAAAAPILAQDLNDILFVYADEYCPCEYAGVSDSAPPPLAFSAVLSSKKEGIPVVLDSESDVLKSAQNFLEYLTQKK
jgi:hypothetical protein